MSRARLASPAFLNSAVTCASTVLSLHESAAAISLFASPRATRSRTCAWRQESFHASAIRADRTAGPGRGRSTTSR